MSVADIYNFIEVSDTVATAGQPTAMQFRDAREAGYEVVVNLAPDGLETSLPGEAGILGALGFDYRHIPVPWNDPTLAKLEEFERTMTSLGDRRTLIHCQANFRVTAFYASYAMARLGWTREKADALVDRIWSSRPGYEMDDNWKRFLSEARRRLQS